MAFALAPPNDPSKSGQDHDLQLEQPLPKTRAHFTWELPKHRNCEHRPGPVVAVRPNGRKLVFCLDCNLLCDLAELAKKSGRRVAATPEVV